MRSPDPWGLPPTVGRQLETGKSRVSAPDRAAHRSWPFSPLAVLSGMTCFLSLSLSLLICKTGYES